MNPSPFSTALRARLTALDLSVDDAAAQAFEQFYTLLAKWNQRINLTALPLDVLPAAETLDRLFIEPLIASAMVGTGRLTAFDLGSGTGSPAVVLKILRPGLRLVMVEARSRKAAFLRELVRQLALDNVHVECARFESLDPMSTTGAADLVTVRAVRADDELAATVARILKPKGELIVFGSGENVPGFAHDRSLGLPDGSRVTAHRRRHQETASS